VQAVEGGDAESLRGRVARGGLARSRDRARSGIVQTLPRPLPGAWSRKRRGTVGAVMRGEGIIPDLGKEAERRAHFFLAILAWSSSSDSRLPGCARWPASRRSSSSLCLWGTGTLPSPLLVPTLRVGTQWRGRSASQKGERAVRLCASRDGLPALGSSGSLMRATRSVEDSAFPRGAWERGRSVGVGTRWSRLEARERDGHVPPTMDGGRPLCGRGLSAASPRPRRGGWCRRPS